MLIPDCVTHKSASETVNSASPALQGSSLYTTNNTTGTGSPYQQHKVISTSSHTHPAFTINTWTLHISPHPFTSCFWLSHPSLSVDPAILTFTVNTRTPHIPPYLLILWSWLSPSTQGHDTFHLICWSCDIYCDLHFHGQHKDTMHFAISLDPVTFMVYVFQIFIVE